MRTFIALSIPNYYANQLYSASELKVGLEQEHERIAEADWHLTLRFLGETPEQSIEAIKQQLRRIAQDLAPVCWFPRRLCYLPSERRPKVWAWVGEPDARLDALFKAINNMPYGGRHSQVFKPHISLFRCRYAADGDLTQHECDGWKLDELVLYESKKGPKGARYQKLGVWRLAGSSKN